MRLIRKPSNKRERSVVFWLAGGGNLQVEVVEGDFDDLLWCGAERVEDTVDVGRVDLRMTGRREDALLTSSRAHALSAAAAAAASGTSSTVHDTVTRYRTHPNVSIFTILFFSTFTKFIYLFHRKKHIFTFFSNVFFLNFFKSNNWTFSVDLMLTLQQTFIKIFLASHTFFIKKRFSRTIVFIK